MQPAGLLEPPISLCRVTAARQVLPEPERGMRPCDVFAGDGMRARARSGSKACSLAGPRSTQSRIALT
jgi:hypothetical protein